MTNEKIFEQACKAIEPKDTGWSMECVVPDKKPFPQFYVSEYRYEEFKESAEYFGKDDGIHHTFVVREVLLPVYACGDEVGSMYFDLYYDFTETPDGLNLARVCAYETMEEEGEE